MAETSYPFEREDDQSVGGEVADYIALMKPRVMALAVFTAWVGLIVAPGAMHPVLVVAALLCIAVGAGASGALNMWYDADIDARMARTAARPIPRGRVSAQEARTFGLVLAFGAVLCLGILINWVAAVALALAIGYYIVIYTMWLKRRTPQNIVIGGAAGAFPPVIGWAAATGSVSLEPLVLFAIIFLWTPPHFWALALLRQRDYERVGVPMLPVAAGEDETRRQILIYSVALVATSFAPILVGLGDVLSGFLIVGLNALFLSFAWRVYRLREGRGAEAAARQLFNYSILYLFLLFAVLLVEKSLSAGLPGIG